MLDRVSGALERYLDLLSARQKLVAQNIANADTPGYRTKDLDFKSELANLMDSQWSPRTVQAEGLSVRNDGNNVSLDREARMLAENDIRFNFTVQLLRSRIRSLRSAIQEGRS